jgi:hypothetical protein
MARKRKRAAAFERAREFKLRIPEDVAKRIEKKALAEGRPQNRVIINELAAIPYLETLKSFAEQVEDMKVVIARHGAAIAWHDLSGELVGAVDALLGAEGGEERAAKERLRVVRSAMQLHERSKKKP